MNGLTPRQKRFCVEYVKDGNASRAYRAAYNTDSSGNVVGANATRLLKNDSVASYISALQEQVISELSADAVELREYWTSVMRGQEEVEEVEVVVADGLVSQERVVRKPTQSERLKAAEHLGKAMGLFLTKVDVTSDGQAIAPVLYLPVKANDKSRSAEAAKAKTAPAKKQGGKK